MPCILLVLLLKREITMPNYKLVYFQGRGRAEICRLIFAQAGVEYEDARLSGEEWQKVKPTTPYGSIPLLEVDGKKLAGSTVIARYLAEEFGLAGSNAFENAEIAGIVDVVGDLVQKLLPYVFEKDDTKKAELKAAIRGEHLPRYFGIFENLIAGNPSGWVYGPKVTYADIYIAQIVLNIKSVAEDLLPNYPNIMKLNAAVNALPRIAAWIANRPQTQN